MRAPAASAAQICTGETSGLTDWPIERIADTVEPNDDQRAALATLRDAVARAVDIMRSACPQDLPNTPTGRLAAMRERLETMRRAVHTVGPALDRFYQSLDDEQKARFNVLDPDQRVAQPAREQDLAQVCGAEAAKVSRAPTERIIQALRPNEAQRAALNALDEATVKAAEMLVANCPADEALTPPGRLAAMEQRLDAMSQALDIVEPAMTRFYSSLTDEQKARFNELGGRQQADR